MLAAITRLHDWTAPAGLFFIIQNPPAHWSHLIYGHSFTVGLWIYCLPFCECPAFTILSLILFLLLSPRVCPLGGLISHLHELITQHALQISVAACTTLQFKHWLLTCFPLQPTLHSQTTPQGYNAVSQTQSLPLSEPLTSSVPDLSYSYHWTRNFQVLF